MSFLLVDPLIGLQVALPGLPNLPGLPRIGLKDLKKFRQGKAAPLDSLPPAWRPASRLALENEFVRAGLLPLGTGPFGLHPTQDPRKLRVSFDADSGAVRYSTEFEDVTVGEVARLPMGQFADDLTRRNFTRIWSERTLETLRRPLATQAAGAPGLGAPGFGQGAGLKFELPSPLPKRFQGLLGPGGPSLTVGGSENVRLSGASSWTNQQLGLLGQRRSLFPSLDMQQDLNIRLEGRLSDRVGVNMLQNSANQIPLANRVAINYVGGEDDLVQAFDLGNTNLTLPGTQYVSYSGKNEGLFGMKATTRIGPLDMTVLATKQEGRSERASYAGGASRQSQTLADKDYVRGVYFYFYNPSAGQSLDVQAIDESSIRLYLDEGVYLNQVNIVRGRAFVDPATAVQGATPDSTHSVRGSFRLLKSGADQDYEILSDVYGPFFKVIRLRSALTGDRQTLAVTYAYRQAPGFVPVGDSLFAGGRFETDQDGVPALTMKLLRAPLSELPADESGFYDPTKPFVATRELELKNIYQLAGQRIDPKSFDLAIRRGDDFPPLTTTRPGVPYLQVLGLDNYDETSGFVDFDQHGHDDHVDGTAPSSTFRAFVDFERGTLLLPDPRPFAPRLAADTTGRAFDRFVSGRLFRSDSLVGARGQANEANALIYDKRTVLNQDRLYSIEMQFTAARAGNEVTLGRSNIIEGSDVVAINGQALRRDVDYRIDYDLGKVTLIRQLGPSDQLNIDYSYAPLFQQAGRTLIGNSFRWEGRGRSFGGAFLYESKGAQDLRPRLGEEPSRAVIGDLNTEWRLKPAWITHWVDKLPGVRTSQPSELNVQAEMGASFPNPNTRNEIFIDDMEGVRDAVTLSMSPERWRWSSVPLRTESQLVDDPATVRPQKNAEIHWYSPLNVVKERDLKPSLTNAQGAQNTHQVLALSLPSRPNSVPDPLQPLWTGLTSSLDPVGIDLSRAQFLELWVNDFRDYHNGVHVDRVRGRQVRLHVDLGVVPEDQQRAPNVPPDGKLNSEDRPPRDGQLTVVEGNNEDTGLDNALDASEAPAPVPDLVTVGALDPQGDNFGLPNSAYKDWDPRKWLHTNGTEGDKNVTAVPETEDLNLNNALDTQNAYFEYTIVLGDTAGCDLCSRYLVSDVHESFPVYSNDGAAVQADNGWRRYRIPLADSLRARFGSPDLTLARHVRVWLEDVIETDPGPLGEPSGDTKGDGRPFLVLGGIEIVGSRWFAADLDSTSRRAGTTVTLNTVNTVDHADVYVAPFDPGKTRSGSQELTRREQSLALEFARFTPDDTLEVYKTFSIDENYSRYGSLDWFAAAFQIPGYDGATDTLDYFLRFSSDERGTNYYEYRARMPRSSDAKLTQWSHVTLELTALSNLKLNPDFPLTGDILYRVPGKAPGEQYVIRGRPSFTRLRRISFGIINASRQTFSGQMWLDELRAIDVAKDVGRAQRLNVNGRLANLMTYNVSWNGRDADFQSVGESRGLGSSNDQVGFQTSVDLHRFVEGTRMVLPFSYAYTGSRVAPRFTAGDDVVRTGALAEASDTRNTSQNWSLGYSRNWNERSNPFLRYTVGGITASIARSRSDGRNPLTVGNTSSRQGSVSYAISPRLLLSLPVPGTKLKIFPLPERFYWNYAVGSSQSQTFDRQRDSIGSLVPRATNRGRSANVEFGADSRPMDFLHHSFQASRNLSLPTQLLERVGFINFGRIVRWSQNMDARFGVQRFGPWLRPTATWNTSYRQNNGPELSPDLSVRAVGNQQQIQLAWDLPFDQLRRSASPAPGDTARQRRPVAWRGLLARLGSLSANAALTTTNGQSRMTGTPSTLYLLGMSRDPGFGSSRAAAPSFGNVSSDASEWRLSGRTSLDLGLGAILSTRGDISAVENDRNGVQDRHTRIRFPDLDLTYGRIANFVGLGRILSSPRISTRYGRSQSLDYANRDPDPNAISTSSDWSPLIEVAGDLKNGTRTQLTVNRRVSQSENRQNGSSVTTGRNTTANFSINRSYSKGQKVNILGKETTVKSNINLGLSAAYERQSGETIQQFYGVPQNETRRDRLSVNAQGGYTFSTNVTGNLEFGFGQDRDLVRDIISRTLRVEVRAQFTF